VGEILDTVTLAGIVVTGTYSDGSPADLTSQASFSVPPGGTDRTETVTVTVDGISTGFTINLYVLPETIYIGDPNAGGGYDTLSDAINAAVDGSIITLYEDVQISNDTGLGNKTLTITGYGTTAKKITHNAQGKMFALDNNDKLILAGRISLDGANVNPNNDPLVNIAGSATLEMKDHATITGVTTPVSAAACSSRAPASSPWTAEPSATTKHRLAVAECIPITAEP
jgi:hypothetical protein